MKRVHFSLGDSNVGSIGLCASLDVENSEQALDRLRDMLPSQLMIENEGLQNGEYITVYINQANIKSDDIDDIDDIKNSGVYAQVIPEHIQALQAQSESLAPDLSTIRSDILNTYTQEELNDCEDFDAFFDMVDATNGYEEDWEDFKGALKPIYLDVWKEFQAGKLDFSI